MATDLSVSTYRAGDLVRLLRVSPVIEQYFAGAYAETVQRAVGRVLRIDHVSHDGVLQLTVHRDGSQALASGGDTYTIFTEPKYVAPAEVEAPAMRAVPQAHGLHPARGEA